MAAAQCRESLGPGKVNGGLQLTGIASRIAPRGGLDALAPLLRRQLPGYGLTCLFEAWKIPEIGKVPALLGFHRLDGTLIAHEELALTVGLFQQRQALSVRTKPGVMLDEFGFMQAEIGSDTRQFHIGQTDLARPAATRRASLAFVENRHGRISIGVKPVGKQKILAECRGLSGEDEVACTLGTGWL